MEVSIGSLKEMLLDTVVQDFIDAGFSFNKSKFSFTKKVGKNKVYCLFHFYNFAPVRVEYSMTFSFTIDEIEKEKKKFYEWWGKKYSDERTVLFFEGSFHPKTRNESEKLKRAFAHVVCNIEQSNNEIEDTREVLRSEIFPRLSQFSELENFQKYVVENYDFSYEYRSLSILAAAKLKSEVEFMKLVDYVWKKDDLDSKMDTHILKQLISNYLAFSEANSK